MNKNILIVLGGAVLAAVLVAVLVQVTLGGKKGGGVSDPSKVVQVLVAARDLKSTAEVKEGDFAWREWPKDTVFSGAILREADESENDILKGRYARDVSKSEPMKRDMMLKAKTGNFVAASLEAGERAVSLKVKPENMAAGFIGPGTHVDVILTYSQKFETNNEDPRYKALVLMNIDKMATETILQNVRVLAIDQTVERDFDDEVKAGKTVTLAVPIADAERVALADKMGTIVLALRGPGDATIESEKRPTLTDARMTTIGDEIFAEYIRMRSQRTAASPVASSSGGAADTGVRIYSGSQIVNQNTK